MSSTQLSARGQPMTKAQHAAQRARVIASMLLAPTEAERHGIYPIRKER